MMDLDSLKHTNDTYGHDSGDAYIRQAGKCFAEHTPSGTIRARISGDEFNLLFYGYDSKKEIREKIDELRAAGRSASGDRAYYDVPCGRGIQCIIGTKEGSGRCKAVFELFFR